MFFFSHRFASFAFLHSPNVSFALTPTFPPPRILGGKEKRLCAGGRVELNLQFHPGLTLAQLLCLSGLNVLPMTGGCATGCALVRTSASHDTRLSEMGCPRSYRVVHSPGQEEAHATMLPSPPWLPVQPHPCPMRSCLFT